MTNSSKLAIVAIIIILAGIVFVSYTNVKDDTGNEGPVACTMDAKICPDGTGVGRSGPLCEFAECPAIVATTTSALGQKILTNGVYITPLEILEDSRCPIDVQCIQAGTLRIKVRLSLAEKEEEVVLERGKATVFLGKSVMLKDSYPSKKSTETLAPENYRFIFSVTGSFSGTGTLQGNVTISPVCLKGTPGYPCIPTPEMFAAAKVFVYKEDKKTLVKTIIPDGQGNFSASFPAGTYFVDMTKQSMGGTTGVPTTVTITPNGTVNLRLSVDTGLEG